MGRKVSGRLILKKPATQQPNYRSSSTRRLAVGWIMRTLKKTVGEMTEPALEKITVEQKSNPFKILISTMLSAQTRDPVTLAASRRLFKVASTPEAMERLSVHEIQRLIHPVSFYRNKARHVKATCQQLISHFSGVVPSTMDVLLTLPGVGRKTANLVLILAHRSLDNICVDTHVHRIVNRLGWVRTKTPEKTEQELYRVTDRRWWSIINLYFVTWGQNVCKPVYPLCNRCTIRRMCQQVGVFRVGR